MTRIVTNIQNIGGVMPATLFSTLMALTFLCAACAFDLAHVKYEAVDLIPIEGPGDSFSLMEDVRIDKGPCNYDRTLRAGTEWSIVGKLPQGTVHRSADQVLTIKCSNVFEAYIVVQTNTLVGVYLPVEKGYVRLKKTYPLVVQ